MMRGIGSCRSRSTVASLARRLCTASHNPTDRAQASGWPQCSWEQLLRARGWLEDAQNASAIQSLSSKLSFPLTVAHAIPLLGVDVSAQTPINLCVLGAREEADAVPMAAWMELCVLAEVPHLSLSMIGPEARGLERSLCAGAHNITQAPPIQASFLESPLGSALLAGESPPLPDAFVLFNPGLHAGKYSWRPTMEAVLATERPCLITAYSDQDAASDAQWLAELCTGSPMYVENPWASLEPWGYEGCGRSDARANMYLTILHGRTPAELCRHERKPPSAAARVVPAEQAWLRRSAWNDMFDVGPRVLREALAELPHLAKVWR